MRYLGSKQRFVSELLPIITEHLNGTNTFIDMFGGGMNVVCRVDYDKKIAVDLNRYVIALWNDIQECDVLGKPSDCIVSKLTREEYNSIKQSYLNCDGKYKEGLIGYVGNCCSFGSSWFNGYAAYNPKRGEDHIAEAYSGIIKQIERFHYLYCTQFLHNSYKDVVLPPNSVIYCDPPYASTKKYETDFDNEEFWEWVRQKTKEGHHVYVSEYDAPSDFKCIWEKRKKDSLPNVKEGTKLKVKTEKLFIYGV